jgi:1-deoxy-D-xylulose-5-phosphate reductoisomerase
MTSKRVVILGSTGSIGTQALDVIEHLNRLEMNRQTTFHYQVAGLAAGKNSDLLAQQARRFGVRALALADESVAREQLPAELRQARRGMGAAEQLVRDVKPDLVIAAMVGLAGLPATLAAIEVCPQVAIANKETLVAAGSVMVAASTRCMLLPVDSEHSAVWQALSGIYPYEAVPVYPPCEDRHHQISRVLLTASGGPFRTWTPDQIRSATRADALKHPTWRMGGKVTIDSATLINKTLELIEAHWLFGLGPERLGAIVHPQSIVHAIVETVDGAALAQLGMPDMKTPIQLALTYPARDQGLCPRMDFHTLRSLDFEQVDEGRFPGAALWRECIGPGKSDTTRGAILNAANEEAVNRFLDDSRSPMPLTRISELSIGALESVPSRRCHSLADVMASDRAAREWVKSRL